MKRTITIDIINEKALKLLQELEQLQLIRMRKEKSQSSGDWSSKYKGAMTKQPLASVDEQLNELRNGWE